MTGATRILRSFIDTGMRLGELAGLRVDSLDFDQDLALVMGKGRGERACPLGNKTAIALERYRRERTRKVVRSMMARCGSACRVRSPRRVSGRW